MNQNTDIQELVDQITSYVNTYSLDPEKFITAMSREHRTLQQSFTRLVLRWLEYVASDEYRTDPRNEASHHIAQELIRKFMDNNYDTMPSRHLPMI